MQKATATAATRFDPDLPDASGEVEAAAFCAFFSAFAFFFSSFLEGAASIVEDDCWKASVCGVSTGAKLFGSFTVEGESIGGCIAWPAVLKPLLSEVVFAGANGDPVTYGLVKLFSLFIDMHRLLS